MNMRQAMTWEIKLPRLSDLIFARETRFCFISYLDLIYAPDFCPKLWLPYASAIFTTQPGLISTLRVYFNGYCIELNAIYDRNLHRTTRAILQSRVGSWPIKKIEIPRERAVHGLLRSCLPVFEKDV